MLRTGCDRFRDITGEPGNIGVELEGGAEVKYNCEAVLLCILIFGKGERQLDGGR